MKNKNERPCPTMARIAGCDTMKNNTLYVNIAFGSAPSHSTCILKTINNVRTIVCRAWGVSVAR